MYYNKYIVCLIFCFQNGIILTYRIKRIEHLLMFLLQ